MFQKKNSVDQGKEKGSLRVIVMQQRWGQDQDDLEITEREDCGKKERVDRIFDAVHCGENFCQAYSISDGKQMNEFKLCK